MVGDFRDHKLAYYSNRANQKPHELEPGLYGISNGVLESKWPKVEQGKARMQSLLNQITALEKLDPDTLFHQVMGDTAKVQQQELLPQTGMPYEIEHLMSSIFIEPCELKGNAYGTRSQTLLLVRRNGTAQLHERSRPALDPNNQTCDVQWVQVQESFHWPHYAQV